jgi:two-component system, cell cycle sensor histidine kinase and response regulator CckA
MDKSQKQLIKENEILQKQIVALENEIANYPATKVALEESKERYRCLVKSSFEAIFFSDKGICIDQNYSAETMFGYSREEAIGKNAISWIAPEDHKLVLSNILADYGEPYEVTALRKDGSTFDAEIQGKMAQYKGKTVRVTALRDVTQRKQAEAELKESEILHHNTIENLPLVIINLSLDGKIEAVNAAFSNYFNFKPEEFLGKNILDFSAFNENPNLAEYISSLIKNHSAFDFSPPAAFEHEAETQFLRFQGTTIRGIDEKPVSLLLVVGDISDRVLAAEEKVKLEKLLRRTQRLETIGTLAGGIAHDFNNILSPIMGYTDMALLQLEKSDPLYTDLQHVLNGARRAKDLIEQILLFSKQSEKERRPLVLQLLVKEALKLLRPSIPVSVEIQQIIAPACGKVLADATQIHQVIVNLCTNAWQSMEETGGSLSIELRQVDIDVSTEEQFPNLKKGPYARLSVFDSGPGIDEKVLDHIFEPFFTTKAVDKGTGLGLSVVHGIVCNHDGDVLVENNKNGGTVFHVYLPIVSPLSEIAKVKPEPLPRGTEHIMVVDDETTIADMVKRMLEKFGYKADVFNTPISALNAFIQNPEKYDLLITDFTMPHMNGMELAEQIHILNEKFPIIMISGIGESITTKTLDKYLIKELIVKPITLKTLTEVVHKVLKT